MIFIMSYKTFKTIIYVLFTNLLLEIKFNIKLLIFFFKLILLKLNL